jgi:TatD DNase family protein
LSFLLIDSHCHLDFEGLTERLPEVLANADAAGVGLMVSISTRVRKFEQLLRIAEENANVFCTVGTHPHHAHEELDVTITDLVEIAKHPKVVGIGEAGLDYHYDLSPRAAQEQGFRSHIAAARETGLPLVIHAREADDDVANILEEEMKKGTFKTLLHCFTSSMELAQRGLAIGAYVSFSGILTYKSAENLRTVAAEVPMDRLLVETDSPYLAPVPHRGKSNEPAFIVRTLQQLAAVKGVTAVDMAKTTNNNFFRLFSKVPLPERYA